MMAVARCKVVLQRFDSPELNNHPRMSSRQSLQQQYEQRFNCFVCMCPRLEMVTGLCQHRVCAECLYDDEGFLRKAFEKCPLCQKNTFPKYRPEIPDDNKEIMRALGVRECPNEWCDMKQLWKWEVEEHRQLCSKQRRPLQQTSDNTPKAQATGTEKSHSSKTPNARRPKTRSTSKPYNFRTSHR